MDFPQLYDPVYMSEDMRDPTVSCQKEPYIVRGEELKKLLHETAEPDSEMLNRCDVSYDGVAASSAMNFNSSFGKISMGEFCKVILTV